MNSPAPTTAAETAELCEAAERLHERHSTQPGSHAENRKAARKALRKLAGWKRADDEAREEVRGVESLLWDAGPEDNQNDI